jgi:hypothetical protein
LGRSSSNSWIVRLDRAVLAALGVGLALYVLPFWREGRLRPALWLTLVATLLHVYTSHKRASSTALADRSSAPPSTLPVHKVEDAAGGVTVKEGSA